MDKIKVSLLHTTPKEVVLKAVGMPYETEKVDLKLVKKVGFILKHESVLEHINLSFEILGISRLCLQELARHRIASYTVKSTRFTLQKLDLLKNINNYCVIPEDLKNNSDYLDYCYESLAQIKISKNKNDIKKYFLPENFRTNLIMTINLRSFLNFLNLRLANDSHFEIKHLAGLMKKEALKTYLGELIK